VTGRLVRALPREGRTVRFSIDGSPAEAWEGESLLVAVLMQRSSSSITSAAMHSLRLRYAPCHAGQPV
jgi:hypothetical protein